jgi:hypothetical protein
MSNASPAQEFDKIKHRLSEVEKILMAKEITMKTLGDPDEL